MPLSDAPQPDVLEVSLFGPGVGECVLMHLGSGDWVVVDSCSDTRRRENSALAYFARMDLDPAACVRAVVATHAHDDHIGGISDIVDACTEADFIVPAATTTEEFVALVEFDDAIEDVRLSVLSEFRRIYSILGMRGSTFDGLRYKWAIADRPVFRRPAQQDVPEVEIMALSPSDTAVTLAKQALAARIPTQGQRPRRLLARDPNTMAVVLWVSIGESNLLLGSDLLIGPGNACGWNAVVASPNRPDSLASVYKVAHHGAPNGDHDQVWRDMLTPEVVAILTPYRRGRTPRPSRDDVGRICRRTSNSYIAAAPKHPLPPGPIRTVGARLSDLVADVREADGMAGQIRLRTPVGDPNNWSVDLDPPARRLC
jgi:hypothetical protein